MSETKTFDDEFLDLLGFLKRQVDNHQVSSGIYETDRLSKCFCVSIIQMIRGAFAAVQANCLIVNQVTIRSTAEHLVDVTLIVVRNKPNFNKLFIEYPFLLRKWFSKDTDFFQKHVPVIDDEYWISILDTYSNYEPKNRKANGVIAPREIDKSLREYFGNHWSGLNFVERKKAAFVEGLFNISDYNSISLWDKTEYLLKKRDGEEWDLLGPIRRKEKIVDKLSEGFELTDEWQRERISFVLDYTDKMFGIMSNITHPTPYSCLPHFNPRKKTYNLSYTYSDKEIKLNKDTLFYALVSTANIFALSVGGEDGKEILKSFNKSIENSENIANVIKELAEENRANSNRNK